MHADTENEINYCYISIVCIAALSKVIEYSRADCRISAYKNIRRPKKMNRSVNFVFITSPLNRFGTVRARVRCRSGYGPLLLKTVLISYVLNADSR